MDMEHIMAVLFGPSPPLVGVCNGPSSVEYSTHGCSHSMMEAMWTFTCVLTTERRTAYSSCQSSDMFGGYVLLAPRRPLYYVHPHCETCSLIRAPCAPSCWHSPSHHYHIECTLPCLYKKTLPQWSGYTTVQWLRLDIGWWEIVRWHASGRQIMVAMMSQLFWLMTSLKSDGLNLQEWRNTGRLRSEEGGCLSSYSVITALLFSVCSPQYGEWALHFFRLLYSRGAPCVHMYMKTFVIGKHFCSRSYTHACTDICIRSCIFI
jgi:hypothetical protein